ncbi:MAG: hypothetical protein LBC70_10600 [Chitinispirillales bacterium]|jgi:hypothetical protein|nr:hypothetical protein [Chitinispirillales bacterium]
MKMKRRRFFIALFVTAFMFAGTASAQLDDIDAQIMLPSFNARMAMGFNYDLLRSMTDVSFDFPVGYFGLNLPFGIGGDLRNFLGDNVIDQVFDDSDLFSYGDNFRPNAAASQHANTTVRVDVPMLAGVGSFAYTQNFFFNFNTALGGSDVIFVQQDIGSMMDGGDQDIQGFLSLRGSLKMPLAITMGWETMTLGYAYRINNDDNRVFAFNLHRHLFSADVRLRADIDLLGRANVTGRFDLTGSGNPDDFQNITINEEVINFNSNQCNGTAQGRFRAEAWSPSFGVRWGRFSLNSRFGINATARGSAAGQFVIPKVIDLETGHSDLLDRMESFADSIEQRPEYIFDLFGENGIVPNELDSVSYRIDEGSMSWKMPQGHTIGFDIIPRRFMVTYTKLFGETNMRIDNIYRTNVSEDRNVDGGWLSPEYDTTYVDVGVKIDHILVFQLNYPSFYLNFGVCGIEAREKDNYAFRNITALDALRLGKEGVVMVMPVLSGGVSLGTRLQLNIAADILPLPAVKTGVRYFF